MQFNRRTLLKYLALTGASASLKPLSFTKALYAQTPFPSNRYFVFVFLGGGWDPTLCIDPKERGNTGWDSPYGGGSMLDRGNLRLAPGIGALEKHYI